MNILIIHNKLPYPPKDGGAIAVLNMATSLADAGHKVTLLCFNTKKHHYNPERIPEEIRKKIRFKTVLLDNIVKPHKAISNLLFSRKPYIATRFFSKNFSKALINELNTDYDLVQIEGLYMCHYIPVIRKYSEAKITYRAHNIESEIWQRTTQITKDPFKKVYLKILSKRLFRFEKSTLNKYDGLIPISERDLKQLNNLGNKKPSLAIPTGININNYPKAQKPLPEKNLFFIGALDWAPNQEGLLWFIDKVWPSILSKFPDLKLHIGGRNAPTSLIEKLKHTNNVVFHGELEDAQQFYHNNGIMVVPILSGSGIRIKILEGMAYGKIITTSSIGAEGIGISHKENIFIANTKEEYIKSIQDILQNLNNEELDSISSCARKFITLNYSNSSLADKLYTFYKEI